MTLDMTEPEAYAAELDASATDNEGWLEAGEDDLLRDNAAPATRLVLELVPDDDLDEDERTTMSMTNEAITAALMEEKILQIRLHAFLLRNLVIRPKGHVAAASLFNSVA